MGTTPQLGMKFDAGKPRAGLMVGDFARALEAVAQVTTFGAGKYAPRSWRTVPQAAERYGDAFLRHIFKDAKGERIDPESGLPHLAHVAWNALALLELELGKDQAKAGKNLKLRKSATEGNQA